MTPGEYLRATRKRLGFTLKTVAATYGCSIPYLSDIERGNRKIPSGDIDREFLVRAYDIDELELDAHIFRTDGVLKATDLTFDEREEVLALVAQIRARRT
jgi:transcriptional regulator with XRE-family HTH domain